MNIRNVYVGVNEFKKGCKHKINLVEDERVVCLQIATVF
jgi:hypothetical protein